MTDKAIVLVESRSPDISYFFIRAISLATTVISITVLIGWYFSIPVCKSLIPDANTMKVNTAVGFFFAGSSLLFFLQQTGGSQPKPSSDVLSRFCAGVPLVIGVLTLSEYFFGVNLGIDELVMSGEPDPRTPSPGRMSRMTASGLMLLGIGLMTGSGQIRFKFLIIKLAAITVLFIASFGLLSYLYQPNALHKLPVFSSMALPSAFLFALLSTSLLLAHSALKSAAWQYAFAACIVAAGYGLRLMLSLWVGVELPPFITLYPAILFTVIVAGSGPGIFATVLSSLIAWIFVYNPVGELTIATTVNIVAVSSFFVFGIIFSALIELYGTYRSKAAEYDRLIALQETNQRFKNLISASPCMLFCIHIENGSLKPLWISENVKTILDFSVAEALEPEWWINHVHPDDRERAKAALAEFFNVGKLSQEYRFLQRNGQSIWIREELRLEKDRHGKPSEIIGTWLDISQNKRVDIVQSLRNAVLDQVVSNQKLTSILHEIVRKLEQIDPEMIVSILLLDQLTGKLFTGAAPSLPDYYNAKIDGLIPAVGHGSCGTSAYLGEPVIVDDIDNHPYWQPYLELAQKVGVHACWSMPIKDDNDQVIGTFAIYYRTKRAPVPAELELIGEFTRITALAIQKMNSVDALRQSAAVFENIRDGVFITDLVPNIVAINRSYTEITGYSEDEVLGTNPNILKSDAPDIGFHKALWESILNVGYWKGEIWDRRKNGESYPQWLTISTVFDELGSPKNYVGVITDISLIKQSESALQESERRFRLVTESLPQLIWTCRADGYCDYLSPQWRQYTGIPEAPQLGIGWLEQLHPEDRERAITTWKAATQQGIDFNIEYRIHRHDGRYRWFHTLAVPLRDESGSIVKWYGSNTDIDEQKQARDAVFESEERLRLLVKFAPAAIAMFDTEMRYLVVSEQWLKDYQLPKDVIGRCHYDFFLDLPDRWKQAHQRGLAGETITENNDCYTISGSTERWAKWKLLPWSKANGEIGGIVIFVEDITEQKNNQAQLERYQDHLEQLVDERTGELEEARQEALRLSQVKTVFLANMSHEIRSPMNAMLGFLYLLEQKPLDAEVRDLVNKVRNGGKSLLTVINDILDFSKIEAGQLEIQHMPFRLSDVIDQIAALMSAYSVEKNLELIIDVYPTLADYLIGDAVKLQQVLVNLVSNAIKFTQQGEVKLMIKVVEPVSEQSLKIRFSVKDTGIGIAPAKQQDIFSPFAQADGSISRHFGGTGLGLAISRQLVELMGGSLQVDSEIGKGSTFWFELELEQDLSRNPELSELKHLNVLIVDDCEATSAALANAVKFLGWQAETTVSGQDACVRILTRLATGKTYDVILTDWQMPGMDGLTLAKEIKKMYQTEANAAVKSPLVIMVSAFAREQLLTEPDIGNADLVLTKPLTPSTFYDAVMALLSKRTKKLDSAAAMVRDAKSAQLAGINILVVDDSDVNCELAAIILSLHGAQVMTFTNGYKVIEWLKMHHDETDIILMDVQMPEIDGYETTRLIRSTPHLAHIPIAALTAGAFTEDRENAKAAGMDDFIPKPFDVYQLISVIQRLTGHQPERMLISETDNFTGHSADSQPDSQELPELTLVDETEGVSRFGDRSFYFTYLNKFIAANLNVGKDILAMIQAGDAAAAAAQAHKLKGTAGNLALKRIAQSAADIELSIKTNGELGHLCERLQQDIEATGNEIRRLGAAG